MSKAEADFIASQRQFAAHIRDPEQPAPGAVEERRLAVYRDLFYNNIEGFLSQGFPVLHKLLEDDMWHRLVRSFVSGHASASPYFVRIPEEFVSWLGAGVPEGYPDWLLELAHYEYMELALAVSTEVLPETGFNPGGDLLAAAPVVSPLVCVLCYQYPVHRISTEFQPKEPAPVWLLVYRDAAEQVHFMEINAATARLLALCQEQPLATGAQVLAQLAGELGQPEAAVVSFGAGALADLRDAGIVLGTRIDSVSKLED